MRPRILSLSLAFSFIASSAVAQTLQDELVKLFTFGSCGAPICLPVESGHGDHYIPAVVQGQDNMLAFLNSSIGRTVANFPISSASSGRTIRWVEGQRVETSRSSGPIFAERSQTLGRGSLLFGANISLLSFKTLRGARLENLRFRFPHSNVQDVIYGLPDWENDVIDVMLDLDVNSLVGSFFMTWGLIDKLDISVAVPFVRTEITGSSEAELLSLANLEFDTPHRFADTNLRTASASVNAATSGVGDIALRAKLNITQTDQAGFAILADVRLPTGEELDFLGSGELAVRGLAIYSTQFGDLSPHLNVGYVGRGGDLLSDGFLATVGFDQMLAPSLTLAVDFISEWQVGENKILLPEPVMLTDPEVHAVNPAPFPDHHDNIVDLALGAKLNPTAGFALFVNMLVPLNQARGLRPDAGFTTGVEYRFGG